MTKTLPLQLPCSSSVTSKEASQQRLIGKVETIWTAVACILTVIVRENLEQPVCTLNTILLTSISSCV